LALPIVLALWVLRMIARRAAPGAATFSGGGFAVPGAWSLLAREAVSFVPWVFSASAYDGTLGSLLLVTVALIVATMYEWVRHRREHRT
jgi:hypothetical protein